jgi:hypothetical protein
MKGGSTFNGRWVVLHVHVLHLGQLLGSYHQRALAARRPSARLPAGGGCRPLGAVALALLRAGGCSRRLCAALALACLRTGGGCGRLGAALALAGACRAGQARPAHV